MTEKNRWIWRLSAAVFSAAVILATGSLMRETDQASLVEGSWQIGRGSGISSTGFYNFDKQYLSYLLPAFLLSDFEAPLNEKAVDELITRMNRFSAAIFLVGLWAFAIGFSGGRKRVPPDWVFLIAFLTTPAVLLSAPLASPAIMSAGFLLLLAAVMNQPAGKRNIAGCAVLTFLAVGTRADAVLCLPFFCWSAAKSGSWRALFRSPRHGSMAVAAALALFTGRILAGETATTFYSGNIDPRVAGAYLAFGLGGTIFTALGFVAFAGANPGKRASFRLAGLGFLALPLLFYGPQLFSPRHLITTAIVVLIAATGFRGRAMIRLARRRSPVKTGIWRTGVVVASLVPLLAGIHLPAPDRPGLTFRETTLYPSTDGLWPMGGYAHFLKKLANGTIDHNQQIWTAAKSDRMNWPVQAPLKILETPMRQYLFLAARLRGLAPERVSVGEMTAEPVLADERSLRVVRPGHVRPSDIGDYDSWLERFADRNMILLSPGKPAGGIVWLTRSEPDAGKASQVATWLGREVSTHLGGVDVVEIDRLPESGRYPVDKRFAGRSLAFAATDRFSIQGRPADWVAGDEGGYYLAIVDGSLTARLKAIEWKADGEIRAWSSVLPSYMSRNRFQDRWNTSAGR